ncbi:MAG: nucleotidyltransferase domain-containing protein [Anaerolineales bacterium]|nr:nucleotidyltransferase domain-containing protein [Anaerolineales bacterium]
MKKTPSELAPVVERLVKEFQPEKIILFGSHAWGVPRPDSDWDLMVIVKSSDAVPTRRATQAYRCLRGLRVPVEIIVSTQQEINRYRSVPASLTARILEQGQVLYG